MPSPADRERPRPIRNTPPAPSIRPEPDDSADWLAERTRRWALALGGGLLVSRGYWPSESYGELDSGEGLGWVFTLLIAAILALAGPLLAGRLYFRRSWADLGVFALFILVGLSTSHAADRRIAINLAWQWGGVGIGYFLLRWLPRGRSESLAIAGALCASAVGVAAYGLHQVYAEMPALRAAYLANPEPLLRLQHIPLDPASPLRRQFENRLLGSNEVFATFGLPASLAGYLLGPTLLGIAALLGLFRPQSSEGRPPSWTSRLVPLLLGLVPVCILLYCRLLAKSRSADIGLLCGLVVLGAGLWRSIPRKVVLFASTAFLVVSAITVAVLLSTGRLDREVFTQSPMSFRYRLEYWQGTWNILRDGSTWWSGLGPGNFRGPYLQHKLVQSSEEIADPHDLFLEVWVTAGVLALVSLVAALALGLRDLLAPPRAEAGPPDPTPHEAAAPRSSIWLVVSCGLVGWLAVVTLQHLAPWNEDNRDLIRWSVLGAGFVIAVAFGAPSWRLAPPSGAAFAAATVASVVNLLAAGGIGYPAVAGMLWWLVALGLNLRDDRPCGRRVELRGGRMGVFAVAAFLTALVGTFAGAVSPFWRSQADMRAADQVLARRSIRPEDFSEVADLLTQAAAADVFASRPYLALAQLEYQSWLARGGSFDDRVWNRIESTLTQGRTRPRNPNSLEIRRERASYARLLLAQPGLPESQRRQLSLILADSLYTLAVELHPTSAPLRADAAEALHAVHDLPRAIQQAEIALDLDARIPHADKRLLDDVRARLQSSIPRWREEARAENSPAP